VSFLDGCGTAGIAVPREAGGQGTGATAGRRAVMT
jgi:hypothetical protein